MTIFLVQLDFGYATVVAAVEFRCCSSQIQIKCSKMEVGTKKENGFMSTKTEYILWNENIIFCRRHTAIKRWKCIDQARQKKWIEWMECGGEKGESHRRSHYITNWMYCCTNKYVRISLTRWLMRVHTSCKQQTSATKQQIINLILGAQPKHIIIYFLPHFSFDFFSPFQLD